MSLIFDLIEHDIVLEPISSEEVTTPGPGSYDTAHDAQLSVEERKQRLEDNGPMFALQYAVDSSKTPEEVAEEIPYFRCCFDGS